MKSNKISESSRAVGILASGLMAAALVGLPQAAEAKPAWGERCDRNWNSAYCNPKIDDDDYDDDDEDRRVYKQGIYRWEDRDWRYNNGRWGDREDWDDKGRRNRGYYRKRLSQGTIIPTYPERRRRIVLRRSERYPTTLVVREDVGRQNRRGWSVLPRGSRIEGEFIPSRSGYRFVAEGVRLTNGRWESLSATSGIIGHNSYFGRYDRDDVYVSNGAYSILDTILGRSSRGSVIGDIFDRYPSSRRDLIVIYPDQSLNLRLTRDFVID